MKRFTVKELAAASGVSEEACRGLVNFLVAEGCAKLIGVAGPDPLTGKRHGRGANIYEIHSATDAGYRVGGVLGLIGDIEE